MAARPDRHHHQPSIPAAQNVANDAAEARAQEAQLPTMTVELLGVGVAPRHHRRMLGDAQVGLPQPHPMRPGQALSPLIAACSSLASVGKVMALGCTVVSIVTRAKSFVRSAPLACATRRLSASSSSSLSPSRLRQWLRSERSCGNSCWKNYSPVKYWKYGSCTQRSHTPSSESP